MFTYSLWESSAVISNHKPYTVTHKGYSEQWTGHKDTAGGGNFSASLLVSFGHKSWFYAHEIKGGPAPFTALIPSFTKLLTACSLIKPRGHGEVSYSSFVAWLHQSTAFKLTWTYYNKTSYCYYGNTAFSLWNGNGNRMQQSAHHITYI